MTKLVWDAVGERRYETGLDHGVLYLVNNSGEYDRGYAWNGLTSLSESPSGAEATPQYADNIKYLNLMSAEEFGGTLEAFTYPDEFAECDGTAEPIPGVTIGQQTRKLFGLAYRTLIGNDTQGTDHGYKIHLIYGAQAAPSEKAYTTVNDSPEALTFSWELTTTAVPVEGFKPSATLIIDSTSVPADKMKELEDILYGTAGSTPRLPLPTEVLAILNGGPSSVVAPTKPTQSGNVVTIPTVAGVRYFIDGKQVSGAVTLTKTSIVKAQPLPGYKFGPDVDEDWQFLFT